MPPETEYSITLSGKDRDMLLHCLALATGSAVQQRDYAMISTIAHFEGRMQYLLAHAQVLNPSHPAKSPDAQPKES